MTNALKPIAENPVVAHVIEQVLDGLTLKEALKGAGLKPDKFHALLANDREAALAYARAVEIKADLMADEVVALADGDGDPSKVRNQMQARQWLASKLYAKRYGDRIDLNVTQTIDIGNTLAEARARLLPMRYQQEVVDVESRAVIGLEALGAPDNESVTPREPDIFS